MATSLNKLTSKQIREMVKQLLPTQKVMEQRVTTHLNRFKRFLDEVRRRGKPNKAFVVTYYWKNNFELTAYVAIPRSHYGEKEYVRTIAKLSSEKIEEMIKHKYDLDPIDLTFAKFVYRDLYFEPSIEAIKQYITEQKLEFCRA